MREIRTQMQLTHPCFQIAKHAEGCMYSLGCAQPQYAASETSGIVQLHYYFEDEHHVLLLLEYANGGSLFSLLRLA